MNMSMPDRARRPWSVGRPAGVAPAGALRRERGGERHMQALPRVTMNLITLMTQIMMAKRKNGCNDHETRRASAHAHSTHSPADAPPALPAPLWQVQ